MTEIKTWQQRCMEHPDHQNGMVSDEMIYARMCEEIEELRARVERHRALVADLERDVDRMPSRAKLADRDRRERIATACLTGIASHPECPGFYTHYANEAVQYADALIARLDKEAKP
jgi:hypothetical protein